MTSAEPVRSLQDKHSFISRWKSWGCETQARSEQGWDLNHSTRLQIRPSQNPPLQKNVFLLCFWHLFQEATFSGKCQELSWCHSLIEVENDVRIGSIFRDHPTAHSHQNAWALCVCPEGSGRLRYTGRTDVNLSKKLSSATLNTLYSSYLLPVLCHSEVGHTQNRCFADGEREAEGEEETERGTSPYQLPSRSNFAASTWFPQHLLPSYGEL